MLKCDIYSEGFLFLYLVVLTGRTTLWQTSSDFVANSSVKRLKKRKSFLIHRPYVNMLNFFDLLRLS